MKLKDKNFNNSVQSPSDLTDDQTTITLHLHALYDTTTIRWDEMKAYLGIVIFISCICKYTSVDIMPELKRNILNFGYRINFKYEGTLSHSFDRFYVETKFILTTVNNL